MAGIEYRYRKKDGRPTKEKLWYVSVVDKEGKTKLLPAGPMWETASLLKKKMENREVLGANGIADPNITLEEAIAKYVSDSRNTKWKTTVRNIEWALSKLRADLGNNMKLAQITRGRLVGFRSLLLASHSVNGTLIILRTIRAFFSFMVLSESITHNPMVGVTAGLLAQPVHRALNEAEIVKLISCCYTQALKDVVQIALFTGMRRGEVLGLRKSWIRGNHICLPDFVHTRDGKRVPLTKTRHARAIPIHHRLRPILDRYIREGEEMLFPDRGNNWLGRAFSRAVKRAKMGRMRFHDLRHTYASLYMAKGFRADKFKLKDNMGHTSIKMTDIYVHPGEQEKDETTNSIDYGFLDTPLAVAG